MFSRNAFVVAALYMCGCGAPVESTPVVAPATATDPLVETAARDAAPAAARRFVVVPADLPILGRSLVDWSEDYWHFLSSVPADHSGEVHLDVDCRYGQHGPLFFAPPFQASTFERTCSPTLGKIVFVAAQAVLNSYPCPDPSFQPAPGQTLEDFLQEGAVGYDDLYTNIQVTVDGFPVDITHRRATTPLFTNDVDASLLPYIHDDCLSGSPQPAVADGWYVALLFAPGSHQVRVTASDPGGNPVERTYNFDVRL